MNIVEIKPWGQKYVYLAIVLVLVCEALLWDKGWGRIVFFNIALAVVSFWYAKRFWRRLHREEIETYLTTVMEISMDESVTVVYAQNDWSIALCPHPEKEEHCIVFQKTSRNSMTHAIVDLKILPDEYRRLVKKSHYIKVEGATESAYISLLSRNWGIPSEVRGE